MQDGPSGVIVLGAVEVQGGSTGQTDILSTTPSVGEEEETATLESSMTGVKMDNTDGGQIDDVRNDVDNNDDDVDNNGVVHQVDNNITTDDRSMVGNEDVQLCVFKRGMCITHDIKGIKKTVSNKKLSKKKYGHGWVTVNKTEYSCEYKAGNNSESQDMVVNTVNCRSPANIGISKFDGNSSPGISRVGELRNSEFSMKGKVTTNES